MLCRMHRVVHAAHECMRRVVHAVLAWSTQCSSVVLLCCRARCNQAGMKQELKKEIAKLRRHNTHLQTLANRSSIALEHEDDERADEVTHVRGGLGGGAGADKQLQHSSGLPPAGPDFRPSRESSERNDWIGEGEHAGDRPEEGRCQPAQRCIQPCQTILSPRPCLPIHTSPSVVMASSSSGQPMCPRQKLHDFPHPRSRDDDETTKQRAGRAPREMRFADCEREEKVNGQALSQALARKTRYVLSGNPLAVCESCLLSPHTHACARADTDTHTHNIWRLDGVHEHHLPLQYDSYIYILCPSSVKT